MKGMEEREVGGERMKEVGVVDEGGKLRGVRRMREKEKEGEMELVFEMEEIY